MQGEHVSTMKDVLPGQLLKVLVATLSPYAGEYFHAAEELKGVVPPRQYDERFRVVDILDIQRNE